LVLCCVRALAEWPPAFGTALDITGTHAHAPRPDTRTHTHARMSGKRQTLADKHGECAGLLHDVMRRCSPEHSREVGRMRECYHEERDRVRLGRMRGSDAVINDIMGSHACALALAGVCQELRYLDASAEFAHCLQIFARGTPGILRGIEAGTFSRDAGGALCGDASLHGTMEQVRAVHRECAARCDAACASVQNALQCRRFLVAYNTLPQILALARGEPNRVVCMPATGLEAHRAFQMLLRDELLMGALLLYARHRRARAAAAAGSGWLVFLAEQLGVAPTKGGGEQQGGGEQRLAALRAALREDFTSVVSARVNVYNRRFIMQQSVVRADASMAELREHCARMKRKIGALLDGGSGAP